MTWFLTKAGHLVHAVGEVAAVHRARGLEEIDAEDATLMVESGEAQAQADKAAAEAALVDGVEFNVETHPDLTAEDEAEVDAIIDSEPPVLMPKARGKNRD